jgi:hypothetical protein
VLARGALQPVRWRRWSATALVVWGVYEGANALGLIYRAASDRWPSEMLNPLSWSMWRRVVGDAFHSLAGAPASFWVIAFVVLLAPLLMTGMGLVAVWKYRRERLVLGGFILLLVADLVQLQDGGANAELWRVGWHLTFLSSVAFVVSGWRQVPFTSWFVLLPLAAAVFVQRWWPLLMLVLLVQVTWALAYARVRRRAVLRAQGDAEQADAADVDRRSRCARQR